MYIKEIQDLACQMRFAMAGGDEAEIERLTPLL
jgi:hypothetical protein